MIRSSALSVHDPFRAAQCNRIGRLLERAKDSGRSDDAIGVIRKRFATHATSTVPILEHFREGGTTVHTIDSARSVEGVFASVAPLFG